MSTAADLEAAIAAALDIADAILPFTPAAELTPLVAAAALLVEKLQDATSVQDAQTISDVAVAGIEAAVDAEELAKFPKAP